MILYLIYNFIHWIALKIYICIVYITTPFNLMSDRFVAEIKKNKEVVFGSNRFAEKQEKLLLLNNTLLARATQRRKRDVFYLSASVALCYAAVIGNHEDT
jgi:hypothetical protein